jgi:hypothetical protein
MKKVILDSGLISYQYTKEEQDKTWAMFDNFDAMVSSPDYIHYTNDRYQLPYKKLKETFDKEKLIYHVELLANDRLIKVKGKVGKLTDNINKAVKKSFEN